MVPAHNEASNLHKCLLSVRPFQDEGDPVCVINAQSADETAACARAHGAELIETGRPARSHAIRIGVEWLLEQQPPIDALLIAHADMQFLPDSRTALVDLLRDHPNVQWGAFGHRIDDPRFMYRWIERGNAFRVRRWNLVYGDQVQFIRTGALEAIGGFPDVERLEDVELSLRLRALGPAYDLNCPVLIPNRHWRRGVALTTARNWLTVVLYRFKRAVQQ